jgi:hypothetical protein
LQFGDVEAQAFTSGHPQPLDCAAVGIGIKRLEQ